MELFASLVIAMLAAWILEISNRTDRLTYYFAVAIVLAGGYFSFLGYINRSTAASEYHQVSTQVLGFMPLSEGESVGVKTSAGRFYISPSYLSKDEREAILSTEWSARPADIWLGTSGGTDVKGLKMTGLEIDRFRSAAIDGEFYRRLVNVGFMISGFGVFLFVLHYSIPTRPLW